MKKLELIKHDSGAHLAKHDIHDLVVGVAAKNSNKTNYNLDFGKIRKYEKHLLRTITGQPVDKIFFINQQHKDEIIRVDMPTDNKVPFIGNADAMLTGRKNFCLVIRTADCVPVIAYDPVEKCVAAIHSGWRSTKEKISVKTVQKMTEEFGSNPENIKIFILPAISKDSYQVNMDVASHFEGHYAETEDGIYLDLVAVISSDLQAAGISEENIFNSEICTSKDNKNFFSHRKGDKGRNLNFVYLK